MSAVPAPVPAADGGARSSSAMLIVIGTLMVIAAITTLQRSTDRVQQATEPVAPDAPTTVQLASAGILAQVSLQTAASAPVVLSVVFLTYFLLANGPLFRRKRAGLLPDRDELQRREHLLGEIGVAASRYLVTVTTVNAGVGALTALALWLIGFRVRSCGAGWRRF